jgi:hypothetical protein
VACGRTALVPGVAGRRRCFVFCYLVMKAENGEHIYKLRGVWITKKEWPGNSNYQLCHMQISRTSYVYVDLSKLEAGCVGGRSSGGCVVPGTGTCSIVHSTVCSSSRLSFIVYAY